MDYRYIRDFQKLGLGVFAHFGLYSVVGKGEWYAYNLDEKKKGAYENTINKFKVKKDWAQKLVAVAKAAGAKYITLTTRHHDGFSLYDTCGLSDFDAASHSACNRDLVAEFVEACNAENIVPFFYHTLIDWHNADYKNNFSRYVDYLAASVELLCKNYGKVGGFWFDGLWDNPEADWQFDRLFGIVRKYQPTAIIVNNTGLGAQGKVSHPEVDCVTFERGNPCLVETSDKPRVGEVCEGLTDHWGYAERDICVKPAEQLVKTYVDCRKCGCNFLVNTGLQKDGSVSPVEGLTLANLGKWIDYCGTFLYNALSADFTADNAEVFRDNDDYYVVVKDVPMCGNANVARGELNKKVTFNTGRKIGAAVWADNGEQAKLFGNILTVSPFDYGTSLCCRVAKLTIPRTKIAFLGDSITQGAGASGVENRYSTLLCNMLDATELNYGVGGSRIAAQKSPSENRSFDEYFLQRAKKMDKDVDFLFVFGGTNDYGHGDASFGHDEDISDYTFCGALNNLLQYLTQNYSKRKICFVLPLHRYNESSRQGDGSKYDGEPLEVYRAKIAETCAKYGVECIDICDVFPLPQNAGDEFTLDGLHPNDVGHMLVAERLKRYLSENEKL